MFIHLWHVHHHQEAFDWVWNSLLPEQQKQRFMTRNISVDFLDDVFAVTGPDWLESNLVFDFNGEKECENIVYLTCAYLLQTVH